MSIVSLTTPPGVVPPAEVSVSAGAPTSDQGVEAPNVGAEDLADLARMDSDAG